MISSVTGIILAGGKSSRMGEDKAFISFSGRPLIEVLIDKLSALFEDLIIVTNKPHRCEKYGIRIEGDILKDRGPLGGIHTGLISSPNMFSFIAACDMPFINQNLIRYMIGKTGAYDAVIAQHRGRLQPLCAMYSKNCIRPIEKELRKDQLKMTDFLRHINVRSIGSREIVEFDPDGRSFININTKEDYQCILQSAQQR